MALRVTTCQITDGKTLRIFFQLLAQISIIEQHTNETFTINCLALICLDAMATPTRAMSLFLG